MSRDDTVSVAPSQSTPLSTGAMDEQNVLEHWEIPWSASADGHDSFLSSVINDSAFTPEFPWDSEATTSTFGVPHPIGTGGPSSEGHSGQSDPRRGSGFAVGQSQHSPQSPVDLIGQQNYSHPFDAVPIVAPSSASLSETFEQSLLRTYSDPMLTNTKLDPYDWTNPQYLSSLLQSHHVPAHMADFGQSRIPPQLSSSVPSALPVPHPSLQSSSRYVAPRQPTNIGHSPTSPLPSQPIPSPASLNRPSDRTPIQLHHPDASNRPSSSPTLVAGQRCSRCGTTTSTRFSLNSKGKLVCNVCRLFLVTHEVGNRVRA